MANIGIAGIGFMGWIHWLAYKQVDGMQVKAICTRDQQKRSGDWRGIRGNFGPPGEEVDLAGIRAYSEFDELLHDKSIDLIDICLPPHLHVDATCRALEAGKHVFCEKPMGLTPQECDQMCAAADKTKKQLLIGQVLPFFPEYAHALAAIQRGDFGAPIGGYFKRVISDPSWLKDFYDPKRVGGPLIDLHVHDAHLIRVLFGMPKRVISQGRMRGEVVEHCTTLFDFADRRISVAATCGVIHQQGRPFTHGFEIHCERATLQYEFAVVGESGELLMPLTVYDQSGKATRPQLGDGDPLAAFRSEITEVREALQSGKPSPLLSGALARDAIVLCQRQSESVEKRQPVDV